MPQKMEILNAMNVIIIRYKGGTIATHTESLILSKFMFYEKFTNILPQKKTVHAFQNSVFSITYQMNRIGDILQIH